MRSSLMAAVFCVCAYSAGAAEKIQVNMSMNDAYAVMLALNSLDGSQHIVTNATGKETAVLVPYKLGDVRLTIAHDMSVLNARIAEYRDAVAKSPKDAASLAVAKVDFDLLTITASDLSLTDNSIPPSVLAGLAPICPTCVGSDAPARK